MSVRNKDSVLWKPYKVISPSQVTETSFCGIEQAINIVLDQNHWTLNKIENEIDTGVDFKEIRLYNDGEDDVVKTLGRILVFLEVIWLGVTPDNNKVRFMIDQDRMDDFTFDLEKAIRKAASSSNNSRRSNWGRWIAFPYFRESNYSAETELEELSCNFIESDTCDKHWFALSEEKRGARKLWSSECIY
jgi:hypothetical protein